MESPAPPDCPYNNRCHRKIKHFCEIFMNFFKILRRRRKNQCKLLTETVIDAIITASVIKGSAIMNSDLSNFKKISHEKQKTVINAGFLCFGQNGYDKASVADIARAAGISKASLFQYFGTKRDMYLFLYDFAGKEVSRRIPQGTDDYFECAQLYVKSLAEMSKDYPNLFDFLVLQTQRKDFSEVEGLLELADEVCSFNVDTLYANVDWSRFRESFDKDTVTKLFNWLSAGCISQLSRIMEPEQVFDELLRCLRLLKTALYV